MIEDMNPYAQKLNSYVGPGITGGVPVDPRPLTVKVAALQEELSRTRAEMEKLYMEFNNRVSALEALVRG